VRGAIRVDCGVTETRSVGAAALSPARRLPSDYSPPGISVPRRTDPSFDLPPGRAKGRRPGGRHPPAAQRALAKKREMEGGAALGALGVGRDDPTQTRTCMPSILPPAPFAFKIERRPWLRRPPSRLPTGRRWP